MKFSIIVPVYNVELYLAECLDSILCQSFRDFEVICIDDASTDGSYKILKKYAEQNGQIRLIQNKSNRGLSYSRNRGVENAAGDYILFVDSDDMLAMTDALDILNDAVEADIEIISFRCLIKNEGKVAKEQNFQADENLVFYEGVQTGQSWFMERIWQEQMGLMASVQLYKKDFLTCHKLAFYEGILHEDLLYTFQCALAARTVRYIHQFIYVYRRRDFSITSTICEKRLDSYVVVLGEILARWRMGNLEKGMNEAIRHYLNTKIISVINKMCVCFPKHAKLETGSPADQFLFDIYRGIHQHQNRYVKLNEPEIAKIKMYEERVVFGAGIIANELISCLTEWKIGIKAVAVSDKSINVDSIHGIRIYQIEQLVYLCDKVLIIVAAFTRSHKTISQKLEELGFQNIMYIDTDKSTTKSEQE